MKLEVLTILSELKHEKYQKNGCCRIWLRIGDFNFPENNWFDFSFFLLPEWSFKLTELINNKLDRAVIRFVDGDYAVEFVLLYEDCYKASFGRWNMFDDIFDKSEQNDYVINIKDFAKALITTNEKIIGFVKKENIKSIYYDAVEKWNNKLKQAVLLNKK